MKKVLNIMFVILGVLLVAALAGLFYPGGLEKVNGLGMANTLWMMVFGGLFTTLFLGVDLMNRVSIYRDWSAQPEANQNDYWKSKFPTMRMCFVRNALLLALLGGMALMVMLFFVAGNPVKSINQSWIWWGIKLSGMFVFLAVIFLLNAVMNIRNGDMVVVGKPLQAESAEDNESIWNSVFQIRPTSTDKDMDMQHDFDGIRELDNPPPPWFMYLFYSTIVFAGVYAVRYMITQSGMNQNQEYTTEMAAADVAKKAYEAKQGDKVDEKTATLVTDAVKLKDGAAKYAANCAVCHGPDAGGLVGPNLTDQYWIYGGDVKDLFKTIKYGTAKGMAPWKDKFSGGDIQSIASYVLSLQGTKPANPKQPEGNLYDPKAVPAGKDSSAAAKPIGMN